MLFTIKPQIMERKMFKDEKMVGAFWGFVIGVTCVFNAMLGFAIFAPSDAKESVAQAVYAMLVPESSNGSLEEQYATNGTEIITVWLVNGNSNTVTVPKADLTGDYEKAAMIAKTLDLSVEVTYCKNLDQEFYPYYPGWARVDTREELCFNWHGFDGYTVPEYVFSDLDAEWYLTAAKTQNYPIVYAVATEETINHGGINIAMYITQEQYENLVAIGIPEY